MNRSFSALAAAAILVLALSGMALAADVDKSAELEGTAVTSVEIEQGASANVDVLLSASGAINCGITSSDASTAQIHTEYSLSGAGTFSSSTLGSTLNVFSSGTQQGQHCAATWSGAPTKLRQTIEISVDPATPPDTYTLAITDAAQSGRVTITNPSGLTPSLSDKAFSLDVVVVAAASEDPEYTIDGFYQPVQNRTHNSMKGGPVVPLKFNILGEDGNKVDDVDVIQVFVQKQNCNGTNSDVNILTDGDTISSGKTELRWDAAGGPDGDGQWVFNWKTPKVNSDTCYRILLQVNGDSQQADFHLRR